MLLFIFILFVIVGLINVVFVKIFDDISVVLMFVLILLIYLGGVFYLFILLFEFW